MVLTRKISPGDRFGSWTVLAGTSGGGSGQHIFHECQCVCGNTRFVRSSLIRSGSSTQCKSCQTTSHGHVRYGRTHEYNSWRSMIERCTSTSSWSYPMYGAKGISVCDEWVGKGGLESFISHMGPAPSKKHSVDRIDNSMGYVPGNVRWATFKEQCRNKTNNKMISFGDKTKCLAEWLDQVGLTRSGYYARLKRGMTETQALRLE